MDTAPHHHPYNKHNHLPPSPPPSPPAARRRHRKKESNDPFLLLGHPANQSVIESLPSSPPDGAESSDEPLYKRIFVTPFLFISFLLSLFLVDTQNAISRTKNSTIFNFLDADPYQDPSDSSWSRSDSSTHVEPPSSLNPGQRQDRQKRKRKPWHLHKKIRKIARLEIRDAFDMRKWVMVAMAATMIVALYAALCVLKWISNFLR